MTVPYKFEVQDSERFSLRPIFVISGSAQSTYLKRRRHINIEYKVKRTLINNSIYLQHFRFRFDEMCSELYSDSDSMSYNSLSRSSSLIQFESLERQIDTPHSGSTPALNDPALDTKLKDFLFNKKNTNISSNAMIINGGGGGSAQTAKSTQQSSVVHHNEQIISSSSDSDTYSSVGSTSSSYSSEESYYLNQSDKTASLEEVKELSVSPVKNKARAKNSIESLSEDSGYCDQGSCLLRVKSKSNPNLLAAAAVAAVHVSAADDEQFCKSMDDLT